LEDSPMLKITPFLWFDNNAEEAMNFYVSIFKNSKILHLRRFENAGPGGKGTVVNGLGNLYRIPMEYVLGKTTTQCFPAPESGILAFTAN